MQHKIATDLDEYSHEGEGSEAVSIAFGEPSGGDCTWQADVWATLRDTGDLKTSVKAFVGRFRFGPAPAGIPLERVIATASLPGVQRWSVFLRRLSGTTFPSGSSYTIDVMPGRCKCSNGGTPGLTVLVPTIP